MSYVSVYENKTPRSKGLIMTGAVHAAIVAAVIAMPAIVVPDRFEGTILAIPVRVQPTPEPVVEEVKPDVRTAAPVRKTAPEPRITDLPPIPKDQYATTSLASASVGEGMAIPLETITLKPDPVIVGARLNTRYADRFQPAYPPGQLRLEREGEVSVRVLVGTDGRVKQIELIDAPHEDFWEATRRQALSKWRFTPETRDGKPFESWITLKVRFEINS
ncbi:TonB family protein [uncultured Parasphingorhabdus sp.]|uniref:energy transducer TonB n=1 Tax=uncultured Parasphingorhabdus sp. TaxID=2709694 RepID=UPI002AA8CBAE|nr:TonB family protein [uncultured Parasphingorhabdus sp.]